MQEIEATVVDGNGTETGHIIATTIGGRNGQPKQVWSSVECHDAGGCCDDEGLSAWCMGANSVGNRGREWTVAVLRDEVRLRGIGRKRGVGGVGVGVAGVWRSQCRGD